MIKGVDLNDRYFKPVSGSPNGQVNSETIFHYHQKKNIVWATYEGGSVLFGTLSGSIVNGKLQFSYQHQDLQGAFLTGFCTSVPEIKAGILRLYESWKWTCGDLSEGQSVLEEIPSPLNQL
jgi:hypothetical protein